MLGFAFPSRVGLAFALLGVVSPAPASAPPAKPARGAVRALKDITYYDGPGQHKVKHKLDLFLPEGRSGFPVLLFVHGGAWVHGDKNTFGFYSALGVSLAKQGVGVAVTNYRLSPQVKHPEHVKDVARAFAWLHKNIGKYGGSPDRLFVSGHSAGGHLVSLLATDESYLKALGLTARAIRGVIPISGVYRIPDDFLPSVFGTDAELRKQASPIRHARAGLPPFLILYADKDFASCGRKPSEEFCKALKGKGARAETLEIKDSNHYWIIVRAALPGNPVPEAILKFIRAQAEE
jgi:acetyl esterase/lipase